MAKKHMTEKIGHMYLKNDVIVALFFIKAHWCSLHPEEKYLLEHLISMHLL